MEQPIIKKKRGRKSKKELELLKKLEEEKNAQPVVKVPKKRGRKPKGGKIVETTPSNDQTMHQMKENIILHLKCTTEDLQQDEDFITSLVYEPTISTIDPYNKEDGDMFFINNESGLPNETVKSNNDISNYNIIQTKICETTTSQQQTATSVEDEVIWKKLKELNHKLHNNKIVDKNSACFWCTCEFSNPPIYIPKTHINDTYEVYGSFCVPECAVGFLFRENIDNTTRWERYAMMNNIYSSIFKYKKNIKPAPEPYYLLDKFYGTLTSAEYRALMRKDKLLMVVDKPLTRVLPELYEDNNEFNINNSSKSSTANKYKLSRAKKRVTKNEVNFFNV
jgi:hypothetical protein